MPSFFKAKSVDVSEVVQEYEALLLEGESVELAYKLVRDLVIFTDRRLILIDIKGIGTKKKFTHVPYKNISHYAVKSAGIIDTDADLYIYMTGSALESDAHHIEFSKSTDINEFQQMLASRIIS